MVSLPCDFIAHQLFSRGPVNLFCPGGPNVILLIVSLTQDHLGAGSSTALAELGIAQEVVETGVCSYGSFKVVDQFSVLRIAIK